MMTAREVRSAMASSVPADIKHKIETEVEAARLNGNREVGVNFEKHTIEYKWESIGVWLQQLGFRTHWTNEYKSKFWCLTISW